MSRDANMAEEAGILSGYKCLKNEIKLLEQKHNKMWPRNTQSAS